MRIGPHAAPDVAPTKGDALPSMGGKSIRIIDTEKLADARGLLHDIRCLPKDADIETAQAWAKQAGDLLATAQGLYRRKAGDSQPQPDLESAHE